MTGRVSQLDLLERARESPAFSRLLQLCFTSDPRNEESLVCLRIQRITRVWCSWAILTLLVVAQAHFCAPQFVLPDGSVCTVCIELDHADELPGSDSRIDEAHNDCHDCCSLVTCDEEDQDEPATIPGSSTSIVGILNDQPAALPTIIPDAPVARTVYVESCPINGPPRQLSSRAPPSLLTV